MKLETKRLNKDAVLIRVIGAIDMTSAGKFRKGLEQVLDKKPPAAVLSMRGVRYLDSAGLAVMIEALRFAKKNGFRLILASPSESVRGAVELGNLKEAFELAESEDHAAQLLEGPAPDDKAGGGDAEGAETFEEAADGAGEPSASDTADDGKADEGAS